jgi:hypothetical protein
MTPLGILPGAPRAHITISLGYWWHVRLARARLGTALLTWWLIVVLVTTPLQCTLHCLLLTWHTGGHHHPSALAHLGDRGGSGVRDASGELCHQASSRPHAPTAALQAVPTVLSFLPLVVLLPLLLLLHGVGVARCGGMRVVRSRFTSACIGPLLPPPRPSAS